MKNVGFTPPILVAVELWKILKYCALTVPNAHIPSVPVVKSWNVIPFDLNGPDGSVLQNLNVHPFPLPEPFESSICAPAAAFVELFVIRDDATDADV
jgi:hypothetical protein